MKSAPSFSDTGEEGNEINNPQLQTLHVYFHPASRKRAPGSSQIDFRIEAQSDETIRRDIFTKASLTLIDKDGYPYEADLTSPWIGQEISRLVPGHVLLHSLDENTTIYTFGGLLHYTQVQERVEFSLRSTAPLLLIDKFHQISTILADEVEILLAKIKSASILEEEEVDQVLAQIPALQLYCACLQALDHFFQYAETQESMPHMIPFRDFLRAEIDDLHAENLWPRKIPDLWADCLASVDPNYVDLGLSNSEDESEEGSHPQIPN